MNDIENKIRSFFIDHIEDLRNMILTLSHELSDLKDDLIHEDDIKNNIVHYTYIDNVKEGFIAINHKKDETIFLNINEHSFWISLHVKGFSYSSAFKKVNK